MERNNLLKIFILFLITLVLALITIVMPTRQVIKQRAAFGAVGVTLEPATASLAVNEEKPIQVRLTNQSGKKVSFVDIRMNFDKNILDVIEFIPNNEAFPINLTGTDIALLGRSDGQVKLQAANSGTALKSDTSILAGTIKIKGKTAGSSAMTVVDNASQVVGENPAGTDFVLSITGSSGQYTVTGGTGPTGTPTVTPTPTTIPSGTAPVLNFKIKFQGVASKKIDQKVKLTVVKGSLSKPFSNINVTANDDGIYSGSITLTEVPAGSGYKIFIKGPKHLAKKFCENNQTTRCTSDGGITLSAGTNTFDFSKISLEAGDLPDAGVQDGVVNSFDYSLWKARFGREDEASLAIADVNLDGTVNTADWQLMRITLETKYEEDN